MDGKLYHREYREKNYKPQRTRRKRKNEIQKRKITTESTEGFFNSKEGIINLTTEDTEDTERKNKEI